jgi:hypothetical protein
MAVRRIAFSEMPERVDRRSTRAVSPPLSRSSTRRRGRVIGTTTGDDHIVAYVMSGNVRVGSGPGGDVLTEVGQGILCT